MMGLPDEAASSPASDGRRGGGASRICGFRHLGGDHAEGTVTDFHFVNPHCVIEFDVKDDHGQVQNWKAELTSANHLAPKGWSESTVQAGDELAITGYRAKNGAPSIWVTKIHLADGRELKIDSAN